MTYGQSAMPGGFCWRLAPWPPTTTDTANKIPMVRVAFICKRTTPAFSCGARSASKLKERSYLRNMLSRRQLQGFVRAPLDCNPHPLFCGRNGRARRRETKLLQNAKPRSLLVPPRGGAMATSLALVCCLSQNAMRANACLQLRRAISIQAEGTRLLRKHAIAPSAARLCYARLQEEKKLLRLATIKTMMNVTIGIP
jgi:hypothetical protein